MKSIHILVLACAVFCLLVHPRAVGIASAEDNAAQKEIESSIRQFFTSMSKRDVEGLRSVLDSQLVGLEATGQDAGIHWLDTADGDKLLPPKGNNDWKDAKIIDVKPQISTTHPSVAIASFTLTFPLDPQRAKGMQDAVDKKLVQLSDAQQEMLAKMIKDRVVSNSMFAMLAHRKGKWKIICMSLPK